MVKSYQQVQTTDRNMNQLQSNIASVVNPLIKNPLNSGIILENVSLAIGLNSIRHTLGRVLQGWFIVRKRGSSDVYDEQDTVSNSAIFLLLNSSNAVVVDLFVF